MAKLSFTVHVYIFEYVCVCACVSGKRGVKAAVTLSQDHMLAVRHVVKKLTSNPDTQTHTPTRTHTTMYLKYFDFMQQHFR